MLVEKYIVLGIKQPRDKVVDVVRDQSYGNNIIDPIRVIKEQSNNIFVDYGTYSTKNKALERIDIIRHNVYDVLYWSIFPIVEDVSVLEARHLKLLRINRRLKRKTISSSSSD
jgi:hypothetical protein